MNNPMKNTKSRMISFRVTEEQFNFIDQMAIKIKKNTGFQITRASLIMKLIELGLPHLEKFFPGKEEVNS